MGEGRDSAGLLQGEPQSESREGVGAGGRGWEGQKRHCWDLLSRKEGAVHWGFHQESEVRSDLPVGKTTRMEGRLGGRDGRAEGGGV